MVQNSELGRDRSKRHEGHVTRQNGKEDERMTPISPSEYRVGFLLICMHVHRGVEGVNPII